MDHQEKPKRKIHPKEVANPISDILFLYAVKLFRKGFRQEIEEHDLYEVHSKFRSDALGNTLERALEKQICQTDKVSITKLLWDVYGYYYIFLGIVDFVMRSIFIIMRPYCIKQIVLYFSTADEIAFPRSKAYFYSAILTVLTLMECVFQHNYFMRQIFLGIKVRTAFCSVLYRKALKINPARFADASVGRIVTLITKDVHSFESFVDFFNDIWISVLRTFVICYIIYQTIGPCVFVGLGFILCIIPMQAYMGMKTKELKLRACEKSDQRLQSTQEALSAIRIIKMYTWEAIFESKINKIRKKELKITFVNFLLRSAIICIGMLSADVAFYLMMAVYIYLGNAIHADVVYFVMTSFMSMSQNLGVRVPNGINHAAALAAAIKRFGKIIKAPEVQEDDEDLADAKRKSHILPKIVVKNATVSIHGENIVHDVTAKFEKNLTVLIGPVGSGKSFLLKTILQDYEPDAGSVLVQGSVSYASQAPWLFPSSIKQNIVFGEKFDEDRYKEVLRVCALSYDLELLKEGDRTIVEDRGTNLSRGQQARVNLARAIYKNSDIYLLDDCLSALDTNVSSYIFSECIQKFLRDKLVVLVTHNRSFCKHANHLVVFQRGTVTYSGEPGKCDQIIDSMESAENPKKTGEEEEDSKEGEVEKNELEALLGEAPVKEGIFQETKLSGEVATEVYKKYFHHGGGPFVIFIVIAMFVVAQFMSSFSHQILSKWVALEETISNFTRNINNDTSDLESEEFSVMMDQRKVMFYLYSFTTLAIVVTVLGRTVAILLFGRRASWHLHKVVIKSVLNATMHFFDANFIGNILNRFSKDFLNIDEVLIFAFYHVLIIACLLFGVILVIASVNYIFLIPAGIFLTWLVILRYCVLRTTRSLKRLDASTRAPMLGYLNATLEGLTTIRAFKTQAKLREEFDKHQDLYTSANFILQSSTRAFQLLMDLLCALFFVSLITIIFIFDTDIVAAAKVGLVLSQGMMMASRLQWGIRQWAEIENQMTSVERVLEYSDVKTETKEGQTLKNWPLKGEVKYENVNLSYSDDSSSDTSSPTEYVLKNINFSVAGNEKIGIVGRTGAGKSSIISTLFRLYEVHGKIYIDGVDISQVALPCLRAQISIIPQEPVLFSGTIRHNIDPRGEYSDDVVWRALEISHLKPLIPSLDFMISENGDNFSVGQRQLICIARAICKNRKIVVLDEATANMDEETDALIHRTIQENFKHCTVFTIAHKLQSILECDKVLVLEKGEMIEFDNPKNLINNEKGIFHAMLKGSGLLPKTP